MADNSKALLLSSMDGSLISSYSKALEQHGLFSAVTPQESYENRHENLSVTKTVVEQNFFEELCSI